MKKIIIFVLTFISSISFLIVPTFANDSTTGIDILIVTDKNEKNIQFVVKDEDGLPIENALIEIDVRGSYQMLGVTDRNGEFYSYLFPVGVYDVAVSKSGYKSAKKQFALNWKTDSDVKKIEITMEKEEVSIDGVDTGVMSKISLELIILFLILSGAYLVVFWKKG